MPPGFTVIRDMAVKLIHLVEVNETEEQENRTRMMYTYNKTTYTHCYSTPINETIFSVPVAKSWGPRGQFIQN